MYSNRILNNTISMPSSDVLSSVVPSSVVPSSVMTSSDDNKKNTMIKYMNKINHCLRMKIRVRCLNDVNKNLPKIKKLLNVLKSLEQTLKTCMKKKYILSPISHTISCFICLINDIFFDMQYLLKFWDMYIRDNVSFEIKRIQIILETLEIQLETLKL